MKGLKLRLSRLRVRFHEKHIHQKNGHSAELLDELWRKAMESSATGLIDILLGQFNPTVGTKMKPVVLR